MRLHDSRTDKIFDVPDAMGDGLLKTAKGRYRKAALDAKISQRTGKPKRSYKRRDMQAESSDD